MSSKKKPESGPDCPDPCDCASASPCGASRCPVNFGHGAVEVRETHLATPNDPGFQLTWYNRWHEGGTPTYFEGKVGTNWMIDAFAYVTTTANDEIAFIWTPGQPGKAFWFSPSGGGYEPKYGAKQTLVLDGDVWRITDPDGTVWEFSAIDELISRQIDPGGQVTEYLKSGDEIVEKRRTDGDNVESRVFSYSDGMLSAVTLYRGTVSSPHATAIRKVVFSYYTSTLTDKGNIDDLKTVTVQVPQGVGWQDVSTSYYRYYTSTTNGFIRALKYIVGPSGYVSLLALTSENPDSATNTQVAGLADKAYKYDATTRRATEASTNGGTQTTSITYTQTPHTIDYNNWQLKAVATMPDSSTKTVFANHLGQDMLLDHQKSTGPQWIRYTQFNADGKIQLVAEPSAINISGTPYNQSVADLAVDLKDYDGLLNLITYYDTVTPGADGAPGYENERQVQHGELGAIVTTRKLEYTSRSVGSGPTASTVYPISKQIIYRSDASGGSEPVETEYSYTWHSGTTQPETVTTALPDIDGAQNGGDWLEDNTLVQSFDIQGRQTQSDDARGSATTYEYDDETGTVSLRVQDDGGLDIETEYDCDFMGRVVEVRGPAHNIDGQTVRTVNWTVYLDGDHEVRTAQGYLIGSTYTLVNPVSISKQDSSGRVIDEIQATRGSNVESSGPLTDSDTFAQSSWTRWRLHDYGDNGRLQYNLVYHTIPSSGGGSSGTNYDQTDFGYDALGRTNYVKSAAGTITRTVYDPRGLVLSTWVGTNDTGATNSDPTGGSASGNTMQPVTLNTYDTDAYGSSNNSLDGLLTKVTSPVDSTSGHDRLVLFEYDWRDRRVKTVTYDGTSIFIAQDTVDNQNRVTVATDSRVGMTNVLIAKRETSYDDRGRVYQAKRYAVDDSGTLGNALVDKMWYDADGNVLKSLPSGSEAFTKTTYDALSRPTDVYVGYWSGSGDDTPLNVDDDVVFEERHTTYDNASNVTFVTSKVRWHDSTGNGALNGPSGSQPKSRDSYQAMWYDGINRQKSMADYGTNNNAGSPTRPTSTPSSSATVLVSWTISNSRGELEFLVDPNVKTTRNEFDDVGRITSAQRNYGSTPLETTETTYTPDGQVATLTAVNSSTGNQVTTYTYGVGLTNSKIASNSLLQQVTYPDSGEVTYEYNRQGERIKMTDQIGTVHEYEYDKFGRQTIDKVTDFGEDVDDAVQRIEWKYDNRKRMEHVTSYDAVTSGNITSDIQCAYSSFNQVTTEYQQHGAAVNTSTSPKVQYGYADGSANTIRRTSCTHPNTKVVGYVYASGAANKLSRVSTIQFDSTDIVHYEYLGLNEVVIQSYVEPSSDVIYTLATGSGSNPYAGLDRFGRIIDLKWEH